MVPAPLLLCACRTTMATTSMTPQAFFAYLGSITTRADQHELLAAIQGQMEMRLWHEFSDSLMTLLLSEDDVTSGPSTMRKHAYLLHHIIAAPNRSYMTPETYCKVVYLAAQAAVETIAPEEVLKFLDSAATAMSSTSPTYFRAIQCIRSLVLLRSGPDLQARRTLTEIQEYIEAGSTADASSKAGPSSTTSSATKAATAHPERDPMALTLLQAMWHRAQVVCHELLHEHDLFYKRAFSLVTYATAANVPMSHGELASLGYKTAIAGLLAKDVYNFGELVNFQPFAKALSSGTSSVLDACIWDLIGLCNDGDAAKFEQFVAKDPRMAEVLRCVPDLREAIQSHRLGRKVRLMALLNCIYVTPPQQRRFSFAHLAERCALKSKDDVEVLVLAALALKLIEGKLDGLDETLECTWVQPRVLSLKEISDLAATMREWKKSVQETHSYFLAHADSIPK